MERKAQSNVEVQPIGGNVLIRKRVSIKSTAFKLANKPEDLLDKMEVGDVIVEGFGELTQSVELGNKLILSRTPNFVAIKLSTNENDIDVIFKKYNKSKSGLTLSIEDIAIPDLIFIDTYFVIPSYDIIAIIK